MICFPIEAPLGGNVHDRPAPGAAHVPHRGATQVKERIDVDRHRVEPLLIGGLWRVRAVEDPGIVDEDVKAAERGNGCGNERIAGARLAQIRGLELRVAACAVEGGDYGLPARHIAARHHDGGAGLGEDPCAGLANAGGGARDQHDFPGKTHGIPNPRAGWFPRGAGLPALAGIISE